MFDQIFDCVLGGRPPQGLLSQFHTGLVVVITVILIVLRRENGMPLVTEVRGMEDLPMLYLLIFEMAEFVLQVTFVQLQVKGAGLFVRCTSC